MSALWREVQAGSANTLASEQEDRQCALEGPSPCGKTDPVHAGKHIDCGREEEAGRNDQRRKKRGRIHAHQPGSAIPCSVGRRAEESAGAAASRVRVVG